MNTQLFDNIHWVGYVDWNVRDFHGYNTARGSTYNAYLVRDQKTALIDTVKHSYSGQLLANVAELLPLDKLEPAFEGRRETVDLAYAESYTLVAYIVEKGPPGALGRLLEVLAETGDPATALTRAMRLPMDVIQRKWLEETRARYLTWGVPLTMELIIIGIMVAAFVVAVVVKFRYARAVRKRMQEEEKLRQLLHGVEPEDEFLEGTNDEWQLRE